MAYKKAQPLAAETWALAERQHWVLTRGQLLDLRFSDPAIRHRIAKGRLHPIWPGVYSVGRPRLGRHGLWMAAVLTCGPHAFLSHESGATLLEIIASTRSLLHVSVPSGSQWPRARGIRVHRRRGLRNADVTRHLGIPVTSPALTLLDLAPTLSRDQLERAIGEADKRDLIDPDSLRDELERFAGRPGIAALRETLGRHAFVLTDSELERLFLPLARQAGLSLPLTQQHLNGFRVDFYWPELGLVVETDGLRYHRTPAQQAKDRLRDQVHAAAGLTPLRFTRSQVRFEPDRVRSVLEAVAARL
jgi:very-short-patch-repair endonuclease